MMEIPDDVKLFLRAVLVSAPGMKQSNVLKEYSQTTGERLEYTKYGFKNLFELLTSLQGEVTRLEFSPKHEENLVYCKLDESKYVSKHAKKYASKVNTGMKAKSPLEVIEWRKQYSSGAPIPPVVARRNRGRRNNNNNRSHRATGRGNVGSSRPRPVFFGRSNGITQTKKGDWDLLRKLSPEPDGTFRLKIQNIGVNQERGLHFEERDFYVYFDAYNVILNSLRKHNPGNCSYLTLSFPSYFTAYRAWKEKDTSIVAGNRIGLEPINGNVDIFKLNVVSVTQIPNNVVTSSFVTVFAKFPGLIQIDPKLYEQRALISYLSLESAQRACREVTCVHVRGQKHIITVRMLGDEMCSMTPAVDKVQYIDGKCALPLEEAPPLSPVNRVCGFKLSCQMFYQMFQVACKKDPEYISSLPFKINFLVTHQVDRIRFWGWLIYDETVKKLTEVEMKLSTTVVNIQPPHVLPKDGHRGASCYTDEASGKKSWYRCFVLSSNIETDQLEVFYCDYGNSETIFREQFRSTYNDIWVLPPLAVPFKMYGYDSPQDLSDDGNYFDFKNLTVYTAQVIKESTYSEKHIIEIKDVRNLNVGNEVLDEKIVSSFSKPVADENVSTIAEETDYYDETEDEMTMDGAQSPEEDEKPFIMESIFDYDENDLVVGILVAVHNPFLLYLRLGDEGQFAIIQDDIKKHDLLSLNVVEKGDNLLLCKDNLRRRVLVLHVLPAKVKVLCVDFGTIEWVIMSELYSLSAELRNAPFQARPAELAGIATLNLNEANEFLKTMNTTVVKINIIKEMQSGKISVELFVSKERNSVNKQLVELGFAKLEHFEVSSSTNNVEVDPLLSTENENERILLHSVNENSFCSDDSDKNNNISEKSSSCNQSKIISYSTISEETAEMQLKEKWNLEKNIFLEIKSKVEGLLNLPSDELMSYYKERKKEKLKQKLRIRTLKNELLRLEDDYDKVVEKTNQILSLV